MLRDQSAAIPEGALVGAWGSGPFDNDDAADFVEDLQGVATAGLAQRLPAALALPEGYLQMDDASVAVAAAALVAASNGMPGAGLAPVAELIQPGTVPADDQIRAQARAALSRVNGDESEWRDLWADSGSLAEAVGVLNSIRLYL
jgi:Domain of unknown function (DUF4259)